MEISEYLKTCRSRLKMTQEELSHELYLYDDRRFEGIDTTTISKGERGVPSPPMPRLQALIRFFQSQSSLPLPCWEALGEEQAMEILYSESVKRVLGPAKQIVARAPLEVDLEKGYRLTSLRGHLRAGDLLELSLVMMQSVKPQFESLSPDELHRWMEAPGNLFQAVSYKNSFLGMLFVLRLKPKVFDEILNFQREESTLSVEDFADLNEQGSLFILSFYSLSPEIATLLMARLYAHLIAHQRNTQDLGFVSPLAEAHRIGENMELQAVGENGNLVAYRNDLFTILSSETVLKALFGKSRSL